MKLNYIFGIACAQNPLTMQYRVERYQTQHRISGKANIFLVSIAVLFRANINRWVRPLLLPWSDRFLNKFKDTKHWKN